MGNFTPSTLVKGSAIAASDLQLASIKTAHNTHVSGDFPNASIPLSALACGRGYFMLNVFCEGLTGISPAAYPAYGIVNGGSVVIPTSCLLVRATVNVVFYDATVVEVGLWVHTGVAGDAGKALTTTTVCSATATTHYSLLTPLSPDLTAGQIVRVGFGVGGTGDVRGIYAMLLCKKEMV